ncbi:MAG: aldose 1-epimerase family protein [Hyphomicrobiales bacterium]
MPTAANAESSSSAPDPLVRLATATSSVAVSRLGAELRSWSVDGRSLLWSGDPAWWPKRSPVLFPVVGWTRNGEMRIKGRRHPLALHGFAATQAFELVSCTPDGASLRLRDTAATRALYPFAFELAIDYRLTETSLAAAFTVHNPGPEPMPYALGLHPGFAWPLADGRGQDHRIVFAGDVSPDVPVIAPGGLISPRRRRLPLDGRVLKLAPELFANDALCFIDAASPNLAYENAGGQAIAISVEDFPHVALWTKPGAPFLCVECWTGYSDPERFEGDIFDKPSMRILEPGASAPHKVTYAFRSYGFRSLGVETANSLSSER